MEAANSCVDSDGDIISRISNNTGIGESHDSFLFRLRKSSHATNTVTPMNQSSAHTSVKEIFQVLFLQRDILV